MDKYKNQYNYDKTEKGRERARRYRQSEKGKKFFTINNWKVRGIISDDFDKVYDEYIKTTHCKLCNHEFIDTTERCLDHCHQTGTIRNIICRACNTRDYKIKQPIKEKREYQKSFGGRTDCDNNSLLKIDVNLFL